MQPDDQDHEWATCFVVVANDCDEARAWGDRLAARYCGRNEGCEFLRSHLDPECWEASQLPRITVGEEAPDEVIGW